MQWLKNNNRSGKKLVTSKKLLLMPDALEFVTFLNARIGKNDRMILGVFIFFHKPMELVFYNALTCPESERFSSERWIGLNAL